MEGRKERKERKEGRGFLRLLICRILSRDHGCAANGAAFFF